MESLLKKELGTTTLKSFGRGGGGCISSGQGYSTDDGHIFVKTNPKSGARLMFDGEFASLDAISKTNTVKVPKPIKVLDSPAGGAVLVMEYLDIGSLSRQAGELGQQLAHMHLHNSSLRAKAAKESTSVHRPGKDAEGAEYVDRFGFHTPTCCGYIPQDNTWEADWEFYTGHKLKLQLDMIEKESGDREARELWPQLLRNIPAMFKDVTVEPALVHGDLWGGNVGEAVGQPVIFDAAAFYGHHEYELGIAGMFGGFSSSFYNAYHKLIPKAPGFDSRNQLYQLFHYLNHWNHFGGGYRGQSLSIMRRLAKAS